MKKIIILIISFWLIFPDPVQASSIRKEQSRLLNIKQQIERILKKPELSDEQKEQFRQKLLEADARFQQIRRKNLVKNLPRKKIKPIRLREKSPNLPKSSLYEIGKASFYAEKFVGRKTASGEKFSNKKLTAAHKTLPFGTKVRVTNISNGKQVEVIINDRGPYKPGRVIDLSTMAFSQLDSLRRGVIDVTLELLPSSE